MTEQEKYNSDYNFFEPASDFNNFITAPHHIPKLNLLEIYSYYDQPILYLCESQLTKKLYIGIASIEGEYTEAWLYLEVSKPRLASIKLGEIDMYTAFKESESGDILLLTITRTELKHEGDTLVTETHVDCNEINDEMLPIPGEYLTT